MAKILIFYTNLGESLSFIRKIFLVKRQFSRRQIFSRKENESRGHKGEEKNSVTVTETSPCRRNWDELDRDIMELIIMRLNPRDTIRLKNVCKSWRSLLLQNKRRKYPLLLLPQDEYSKHLGCVCLSDGTILNIKLPKSMERSWYTGSSKGWLFMAKGILVRFNIRRFKPIYEWYIHMFNPDSGKVFELPPLSTIPLFEEENPEIEKIELSSPDPLNCVVAATFGLNGSVILILAMCKPESKQWTVFDRYDLNCIDILFLNGELCVLYKSESHDIRCCTLEITDGEEVNMRIIPYFNLQQDPLPQFNLHDQFGIVTNDSRYIYLAESTNGELLLIRRFYDAFVFVPEGHEEPEDHEELEDMQEDHEEFQEGGIDELDHLEEDVEEFEDQEEPEERHKFRCSNTTKFDVFNVDLDTGNLFELKSLGEQVIFVHRGGSPIVCTSSYLVTESNCIYFTEDAGCSISKWKSREIGFYKLGDGRICRFFPSVPNPKFSMGWFTVETHSNSPFNCL